MNAGKKNSAAEGAAIARFKQLQEQMEAASKEVVAEALGRAEDAIETLNALGQRYRLVRVGATGRSTRQTNPDRPCPVCEFKTDPPHDARRHRGQGKNKKAFTASQLAELGLRKA